MKQITPENAFSEKSENLGSQTHQNPAFLRVPEGAFQTDIHNSTTSELSRKKAGDVLPPDPLARVRISYIQDKDLVDRWLHGKSTKTQIDYRRIANELLDTLGDKSLKDTSEAFLQSFVDLAKQKSLHTQKQRVAILKSLFRFGVKKKYLPFRCISL